MQNALWNKLKKLPLLLAVEAPEAPEQIRRLRSMERNLVLPAKALSLAVLFYYLLLSNWYDDVTTQPEALLMTVRYFFLIYLVVNVAAAILLAGMEQLPFRIVQESVFVMAFIDALFLAAVTLVTGGFDSGLYWVFLGLIFRNAVSIPVASTQLVLNLVVCLSYLTAGLLDTWLIKADSEWVEESAAEPFFLRIIVLVLLSACCYGLQVLFERQRQQEDEAREFVRQQEQIQAAGRLAAEIAHQLKNPLGIINNAAFTLQRTVREGKTITQQIQIIREEVERSDRIITELMGYARLVEGKVEKLDVKEELERAIQMVFPAAVRFDVTVERDYATVLPPLLALRNHLSEIFLNILQNSREAMNGKGVIRVSTSYGENHTAVVVIEDNGPGIPPHILDKIFEPYFTTKEKGTGLGLSIVKHNIEMYGGTVRVESELGKGARFHLQFPARSLMRLRK